MTTNDHFDWKVDNIQRCTARTNTMSSMTNEPTDRLTDQLTGQPVYTYGLHQQQREQEDVHAWPHLLIHTHIHHPTPVPKPTIPCTYLPPLFNLKLTSALTKKTIITHTETVLWSVVSYFLFILQHSPGLINLYLAHLKDLHTYIIALKDMARKDVHYYYMGSEVRTQTFAHHVTPLSFKPPH